MILGKRGEVMAKILVLDNDFKDLMSVRDLLIQDKHQVTLETSFQNMSETQIKAFDMAILNIKFPDIDGYEICKYIKSISDYPVIFLSESKQESDKVNGFLVGVDDYICKPVGEKEFRARIRAHLKRQVKNKDSILEFKGVILNFNLKTITYKHERIPITSKEFTLCGLLAQNAGRVFTREQIYEHLYDFNSDVQFSSITEFVYSIRKKFKKYNIDPIDTAWGIGYRWNIN